MHKIELLAKVHDRDGFDCGSEPLNLFLKQTARQHAERGISRTFVLVDEAAAAPKPLPPSFTASPGDVEAVSRTKSQLNALDALIDDALAKRDEERFLKLSSAKEKLWKLVQSVPGQSKRRAGRDAAPPIPTPQEAAPMPAPEPQKPV